MDIDNIRKYSIKFSNLEIFVSMFLLFLLQKIQNEKPTFAIDRIPELPTRSTPLFAVNFKTPIGVNKTPLFFPLTQLLDLGLLK